MQRIDITSKHHRKVGGGGGCYPLSMSRKYYPQLYSKAGKLTLSITESFFYTISIDNQLAKSNLPKWACFFGWSLGMPFARVNTKWTGFVIVRNPRYSDCRFMGANEVLRIPLNQESHSDDCSFNDLRFKPPHGLVTTIVLFFRLRNFIYLF